MGPSAAGRLAMAMKASSFRKKFFQSLLPIGLLRFHCIRIPHSNLIPNPILLVTENALQMAEIGCRCVRPPSSFQLFTRIFCSKPNKWQI
jgi:hypothetical protein